MHCILVVVSINKKNVQGKRILHVVFFYCLYVVFYRAMEILHDIITFKWNVLHGKFMQNLILHVFASKSRKARTALQTETRRVGLLLPKEQVLDLLVLQRITFKVSISTR